MKGVSIIKTCPKCGCEFDDEDQFCKFCGAPLTDLQSKQEIRQMEHVKIILMLILFLCIVLGCYYLWQGGH